MNFKIMIDKEREIYQIKFYKSDYSEVYNVFTNLTCRQNPNTGKPAFFKLSTFRKELKECRRKINKARLEERKRDRIV